MIIGILDSAMMMILIDYFDNKLRFFGPVLTELIFEVVTLFEVFNRFKFEIVFVEVGI